jgi:hypothetical protein
MANSLGLVVLFSIGQTAFADSGNLAARMANQFWSGKAFKRGTRKREM